MKNIPYFWLLIILSALGCKKENTVVENKLIKGLDPSVKLPNSDTTGALAYIEGYIDGERFCLADGKDSVKMYDLATPLFYYDTYQKDWLNGIGGAWWFQEPELREKKWKVQFYLPSFIYRDTSTFNEFRKKYIIPQTFTNFCDGKSNEVFSLQIDRYDTFDGQKGIQGVGTCESTIPDFQKGSYIKLVSIRKFDYVPITDYHYEMIYEFDVKLTGNRHLTKGRMKTWVVKIK